MTDAEAHRNALIIASDCIDVESSTQLEVRYRGLPEEERHQIEAHLERISMELYQRAHPPVPRPACDPAERGGAGHESGSAGRL